MIWLLGLIMIGIGAFSDVPTMEAHMLMIEGLLLLCLSKLGDIAND